MQWFRRCKKKGCWSSPIDNKKFMFCWDHTCTIADCELLKVNGRETCYSHGCKINGCTTPVAHTYTNMGSRINYRFCAEHNCSVQNCENPRPIDGPRCDIHTCIEDNCNGYAENAHTNRSSRKNFCSHHQNNFCKHDDCGYKVSAEGTFCHFHTCKEENCLNECSNYKKNGVVIEKTLYCRKHTKEIGWCSDMFCCNLLTDKDVNAYYCTQHTCREPSCYNLAAAGFSDGKQRPCKTCRYKTST